MRTVIPSLVCLALFAGVVVQAGESASQLTPPVIAKNAPRNSNDNIAPASNDQRHSCENNMRWIEAAKDQWAIENGKTNGTTVDINDLINGKYLPDKFLKCPSDGQYKYNVIGESCRCKIHGTGAQDKTALTVKAMPPSVVKTVPESGDAKVDAAATTQIKVTFSKEMMDESWSWSQISNDSFPQIVGKPKYLDDKKTCVIDVKLEPNKTYVIWLNSQKFHGFKDADANSAVPYLLVFQTK